MHWRVFVNSDTMDRTLLFLSACVALSVAEPLSGPYSTKKTTVRVPALNPSSHIVDVYYASNATDKLRFIAFMHGAGGGQFIQPFVYKSILTSLASWGYVVAAPRACLMGECAPKDNYYEQQLFTIDWARDQAAKGHPIMMASLTAMQSQASGPLRGPKLGRCLDAAFNDLSFN